MIAARENPSATHDKAHPFLVERRISAELLTPVKAMLCLDAVRSAELRRPKFLLESVEGGAHRARYSVIGLGADLLWSCAAGVATMTIGGVAEVAEGTPMAFLKKLLKRLEISDKKSSRPPMGVGLFGYLGYDTVRFLENLPPKSDAELKIAESQFILPKLTVIFDAVDDSILLTAAIYPFIHKQSAAARQKANDYLDDVEQTLAKPLPEVAKPSKLSKFLAALKMPKNSAAKMNTETNAEMSSNMSRDEFIKAVGEAKQYILAGDIFQTVLSQRFKVPFREPPFSFYRRLRRINPSPFLFYFDFGDFSVAGSSPEVMVRLRDGKVVVRPIAGTRRRGKTPAEDQALAEELLADPKEVAEHLMLLDLGRNDVAKVALPGTVKVTEQMKVEKYSHVMHIVSNVEGEVAAGKDALDCLCAGFPAGTVSGAPKVRAMQIIDELEPDRRELYAGAVGYFSAFGDMDTCIALRTALIKDKTLYVQAGAGIVADSDPRSEFAETENKARALITAARPPDARPMDSLTAGAIGLKTN